MAAEMPGVPLPGRFGEPGWQVYSGNDAYGPGGGGAEDDFRTGYGGIGWQEGAVAATLDYSILTSQDPSQAPVRWGFPDPFSLYRIGAARSDELTLGVARRAHCGGEGWQAWYQAGPGLQLSGDLGGERIQNALHGVLGVAPNALPYEHPGLRLAGQAQAASGGELTLGGPLSAEGRAIGLLTTSGWSRWQLEGGLLAHGFGGGIYAVMRQDGAAGHALTRTADAVAVHESGLSVVVGMSILLTPGIELSVETAHNLDNDGQDGVLAISAATEALIAKPASGGMPDQWWQARSGLAGDDTRVPGHGTDAALEMACAALPRWLAIVVGVRDQRMSMPFDFDISGHREMLWAGLAAEPVLAVAGSIGIAARLEGGAGWRSSHLESHGYLTIDGCTALTTNAALARGAAGLHAFCATVHGTFGALVLLEATAAPARSAQIDVLDPVVLTTQKSQRIAVEGSSLAGILALTAGWAW